MFDNLREDANSAPFDSAPFYEDEAQFEQAQRRPKPAPRRAPSSNGRFLGMTPMQRFLLAVLLFISVCALGSMFLLVFQKISLF